MRAVFDPLSLELEGRFELRAGVNLAHRVFDLLGWHDRDQLNRDLRELARMPQTAEDSG